MIPLTIEENQFYHEKIFAIYVKKQFNTYDKKYCKVRDHHHYTGKYRAAPHNVCNLRYKTPQKFLQYFITVLNTTIIL